MAPLTTTFGEEVHTNLWGPAPVKTISRHKYYTSFTDDHMQYMKIMLLRTKDEALQVYKAYANWAQTQHGARVKHLQLDHGGEYTGNKFTEFLQNQGTERRLTTHDTPQHNGVAELLNRRILEHVHAILHHAQLPKSLWGEAVLFATWLKNWTSTKAIGNMTPFEWLNKFKPDLSGIPEWGQRVWAHSDVGTKLDARGIEVQWVGYDEESPRAHRVYWPGKNRVSVECNVKLVPIFETVHLPSYSAPMSIVMPGSPLLSPSVMPSPIIKPAIMGQPSSMTPTVLSPVPSQAPQVWTPQSTGISAQTLIGTPVTKQEDNDGGWVDEEQEPAEAEMPGTLMPEPVVQLQTISKVSAAPTRQKQITHEVRRSAHISRPTEKKLASIEQPTASSSKKGKQPASKLL
jgi:hypothetical protein